MRHVLSRDRVLRLPVSLLESARVDDVLEHSRLDAVAIAHGAH
jgi:hypothetical protein